MILPDRRALQQASRSCLGTTSPRWSLLGSLLLVMALVLAGKATAQGGAREGEESLQVAGRERTFLVHVPPQYDGVKPLPLVIVLHGGAGNGSGAAQITGFSLKADQEGFVVVYPNGAGRFHNRWFTWNSGNCCGYAMDHNVDDVGFIRALIDRLEKDLKIDPKRIYATGLSNGGMMSYRLGCELSDRLAAVAPVAGALNDAICRPAEPVSVIIFHGTADPQVPYNGGEGPRRIDPHPRVDKPVSYAVSFWVNQDSCSTRPARKEKGHVVEEKYSGGRNGSEVVLCTIKGEGHTWPGGKKWAFWADEPTREISATDVMWDFFAAHPKP